MSLYDGGWLEEERGEGVCVQWADYFSRPQVKNVGAALSDLSVIFLL